MKTLRQRLVQLSTETRAHPPRGVGDDDDVGGVICCSIGVKPRFYSWARGWLQRRGSEEQCCEK